MQYEVHSLAIRQDSVYTLEHSLNRLEKEIVSVMFIREIHTTRFYEVVTK